MREKYYKDLGLDDGIDILEKFYIDIDKIVENKNVEEKDKKNN